MSGEMNPEVVGCDASIMKNVWEIRVREYQQKMLQEQDRLEKSALPSINKDWANRMTAKIGGCKRVERKVKPADGQTDNIWKSKQPLIPQTAPQSKGPLGRPGIQTTSTPGSNFRDKKRQDKTFTRLQLLMFITQTQPSSLVWGKAWRYNKSLPLPAEGSTDWGQNWKFATHQPSTPNESNQVDPLSLHLWRKPDYGMVESLELDSGLPSEEWKTSWKTSNKIQKDEPVNGKNVPKLRFVTSLVESQHQNEAQCPSEWINSWQSTKPANQQDGCADPNKVLQDGSNANTQSTQRETSSTWEDCWRLVNHHGNTKSKSSHSPEWDNSWRAATAVYHKSNPTQNQDYQRQQAESHFYKTIHASTHNSGLCLQLCSEALTEWNNSWQIPKNNSKPSEEIDQVLKAPPPFEPQMEQKNPTEKADLQLRHDVMYSAKTESIQAKLPLFKQLDYVLSSSEWRDSWKLIKHRMKPERTGSRPGSLKSFRESGKDVKFAASEWKNSWKLTSQPLNQKPDQWQQSWPTSTEIRVKWERTQNYVSLMEYPKNGPTTERIWGDSWRFSRHQHQSDPGQWKEQVSEGKLYLSTRHPDDSWEGEKLPGSISDWQDAWMVSETPLRYDKPALAQWREAWKWSTYHTLNWTEQMPVDRWVDESVKILQKSLERAGSKISSSFYDQMFKERYPETEWSSSWITGSVNFLPSCYGSSGITDQTKSSFGPQWVQSFRLTNTRPDLEQTWLDTCPNPSLYSVLWSRGNKIQNDIKSNLNKKSAVVSYWMNSHQFLQNANAQVKDKRKSKQPNDPRVILTGKIKTKKHLYSSMEKQSDRKWAGCHLLGKTQPRPKRGRGSVNKPKSEDKTEEKFFEEWMESWRFLVRSECMKKQFTFKLLSGWSESWKFLLPSF